VQPKAVAGKRFPVSRNGKWEASRNLIKIGCLLGSPKAVKKYLATPLSISDFRISGLHFCGKIMVTIVKFLLVSSAVDHFHDAFNTWLQGFYSFRIAILRSAQNQEVHLLRD
jgi:hypothetical protein